MFYLNIYICVYVYRYIRSNIDVNFQILSNVLVFASGLYKIASVLRTISLDERHVLSEDR